MLISFIVTYDGLVFLDGLGGLGGLSGLGGLGDLKGVGGWGVTQALSALHFTKMNEINK